MADMISSQFPIPLEIDSYPLFLESVLENITAQTSQNPLPEELFFKIKWVLIELSTNAYKHANSFGANLEFILYPNKVIIKKTDHGVHPFFYDPGKILTRNKIKIYKSTGDTLFALQREGGEIIFYTEKNNEETLNIETLSEHFGLLIIIKSCDELTYTFDEINGMNTFTAVINY